MKISASKKQLAKIISENGGWLYGEFAVQNGNHGRISFSNNKPTRYCATGWDASGGFAAKIECCKPLPNWHQTVLARDEYFHLYPAPDADGWIEWKGGACPVGDGKITELRRDRGTATTYSPEAENWVHYGTENDIIAYRLRPAEPAIEVIQPEEPAKPTIEQLAADYRAKLAIAQQAQEEADSHRCGAEAALEMLYQAGLAIGLDIAIADSSPEDEKQPELVITDWGDLQVGDEVECVGYDKAHSFGNVTLIDELGSVQPIKVLHKNGDVSWPSHWKFIRRP